MHGQPDRADVERMDFLCVLPLPPFPCPEERKRRLERIVDETTAEELAQRIEQENGSKVVDGRVQLDLAVLGHVLGRHGSRLSRGALAELFRWHNDRRPEIHHTKWERYNHYVFILRGDPDLRQGLAELISSALQYWSVKVAGELQNCSGYHSNRVSISAPFRRHGSSSAWSG